MRERPIRGQSSQRGVERVEMVRRGRDGTRGTPLQTVLVCEGRIGSVVVYELMVRDDRERRIRFGVL